MKELFRRVDTADKKRSTFINSFQRHFLNSAIGFGCSDPVVLGFIAKVTADNVDEIEKLRTTLVLQERGKQSDAKRVSSSRYQVAVGGIFKEAFAKERNGYLTQTQAQVDTMLAKMFPEAFEDELISQE